MGKTLTEIAQTLKGADKKVQLIYAFNGVGKLASLASLRIWLHPKVKVKRQKKRSH